MKELYKPLLLVILLILLYLKYCHYKVGDDIIAYNAERDSLRIETTKMIDSLDKIIFAQQDNYNLLNKHMVEVETEYAANQEFIKMYKDLQETINTDLTELDDIRSKFSDIDSNLAKIDKDYGLNITKNKVWLNNYHYKLSVLDNRLIPAISFNKGLKMAAEKLYEAQFKKMQAELNEKQKAFDTLSQKCLPDSFYLAECDSLLNITQGEINLLQYKLNRQQAVLDSLQSAKD